MSGLDVKVILLFTLLGTALASRTLSKAEANSMTDYAEMQDEDLELTLQQDKAQLILTYAKIAEEYAEVSTQCQLTMKATIANWSIAFAAYLWDRFREKGPNACFFEVSNIFHDILEV